MSILEKYRERVPEWARDPILLGYRGSDAHGTKLDDNVFDDEDIFAVVVHPLEYYLSLEHVHKTKDCFNSNGEALDIEVFELSKFLDLTQQCNPNVLCYLWNNQEHYLYCTPEGEMLLENKRIFLSRRVFPRLVGYAKGQMERAFTRDERAYAGYMGAKRKALVDAFGYDVKDMAHVYRLLKTGVELLSKGTFNSFRPEEEIAVIKAIKSGKFSKDEAKELLYSCMAELNNHLMGAVGIRAVVDSTMVNDLFYDIVFGAMINKM